ncbi:MAG: tRNA (5-methylaminomethyl-2-thiouridine)(34)-methyltransferase MnmD, partial [Gemmobacter sp.]|nr:tRNA (5-methylaminomethyl-2-thiouridine)(34)-methyltransferase MnmD [Gemmobacter sp.]
MTRPEHPAPTAPTALSAAPGHAPLLDWKDGGIPVSRRFDDPYFSLGNGLAETRHVFLAGNDLPARFRPGFHVAELGFGTGLNLLATLIDWRASGTQGPLRFTSFEAFPLAAPDIARALDAFPEARALADPYLAQWAAADPNAPVRHITLPDLEAQIIVGDARDTLPVWTGCADAWFLDGFSPAKNPELWGDDLLGQVARHTAPGGTCASYTAAGFVR